MKYEDMSYTDFMQNILGIKLSEQQRAMLEIFEENKKRAHLIYEPQSTQLPKVTCLYCKDTVNADEVMNILMQKTKLLGISSNIF